MRASVSWAIKQLIGRIARLPRSSRATQQITGLCLDLEAFLEATPQHLSQLYVCYFHSQKDKKDFPLSAVPCLQEGCCAGQGLCWLQKQASKRVNKARSCVAGGKECVWREYSLTALGNAGRRRGKGRIHGTLPGVHTFHFIYTLHFWVFFPIKSTEINTVEEEKVL